MLPFTLPGHDGLISSRVSGVLRSYLRAWSLKTFGWEEALRSFGEGDPKAHLMTEVACTSFDHSQETRCGGMWISRCLLAFP
jgi:hypothetical protein